MSHLFSLAQSSLKKQCQGGVRLDATVQNMNVLKGMALSLLHLYPKGVREPHWHPNANELSYCVAGKGMMTIFSPGASHDTFIIEPGTLAFVPKGSMHHVENIGSEDLQMLICFDHENPEDLNLSSSIGVMPDRLLGATFDLDASFFGSLSKNVEPVFIMQQETVTKPELSWSTNRYRFNVENVRPQVQNQGGWVKMSNSFLMPSLDGLALYSLYLEKNGAREPHWHPNAHELNYLISGQARITLLSPSGSVDAFDMNPGDLSFMPQGYFHSIENIGAEPARYAVFFNHASPSDIGISGCLGAYSNELLASLFKVPVAHFDALPKDQEDLLIVSGGG